MANQHAACARGLSQVIRHGIIVGILLGFWAFAQTAHAFKMTPIEVTFEPTGSGAIRSVVLQNPSETPAAVEMTVHARAMDPAGEDTLTLDEESFLVIPSQVILMPGTEQVVRLQWLGGPTEQERPFRLIAEQLPIDLGDAAADGGRMRLLVRYVASLYVTPPGSAAQITIRDERIDRGAGAAPVLRFTVDNAGDAHVGFSNLTIRASRNGQALFSLSPEELEGTSGAVVLAGRSRHFNVPLPEGQTVATGPLVLELDYDRR